MTEDHMFEVKATHQTYKVHIGTGLCEKAGFLCRPYLPQERAFLIMDDNLFSLYKTQLERVFTSQGLKTVFIRLPPGEKTKSFSQFEQLLHHLLELGVERGDTLIAFGGGVVGDITGFAASVLKRGLTLIHMPTSLLAQVDSCLGGKTGINMPQGKNLIGTFYSPHLVLVDTNVLKTLPERRLREGYAEIIKYALIHDQDFFTWLEHYQEEFFKGAPDIQREAVTRSLRTKTFFIERDEYEKGERAFLNFGHSFAHALEAETGYCDTLYHGEAVALGMMMALRFQARYGADLSFKTSLSGKTCQQIEHHLRCAGLPVCVQNLDHIFSPERLLERMRHDKKTRQGQIRLVLLKKLGEAVLEEDVYPRLLSDFLTMEVCGHKTT